MSENSFKKHHIDVEFQIQYELQVNLIFNR